MKSGSFDACGTPITCSVAWNLCRAENPFRNLCACVAKRRRQRTRLSMSERQELDVADNSVAGRDASGHTRAEQSLGRSLSRQAELRNVAATSTREVGKTKSHMLGSTPALISFGVALGVHLLRESRLPSITRKPQPLSSFKQVETYTSDHLTRRAAECIVITRSLMSDAGDIMGSTVQILREPRISFACGRGAFATDREQRQLRASEEKRKQFVPCLCKLGTPKFQARRRRRRRHTSALRSVNDGQLIRRREE